jgi:hypothetical protein
MLVLALAFAVCLLGGCALHAPAARPGTVEEVTTPLFPLEYYAWARSAPEDDLLVELYGLELTISATDPVISAVRKSIILSSSNLVDAKTQLQAAELLEQTTALEATSDSSRAYKIFAEVLLSIQQLREELRAASSVNQKALTEIDSLKSRNRELQQQIEELTSIERQIIERERLNSQEP